MGTLQQGRNAWRIEEAGRASILIDASSYFSAVRSALRQAQRNVFIFGWDHMGRRIELAKELLAKRAESVTSIGFTVEFSETSSFSAAFWKATGLTPTGYHRNLG
jgi:methylphosphotriester-DNA--protein-cysteine methyltransferase